MTGDFSALLFPLVAFGVAAFGDFTGDLPLRPAAFFAGVAVTGVNSFTRLSTFLGETAFTGDFPAFRPPFLAVAAAFRVVVVFGVTATGD